MLDGHSTYSAHNCGRQKDASQHYNEGDGSARCEQALLNLVTYFAQLTALKKSDFCVNKMPLKYTSY